MTVRISLVYAPARAHALAVLMAVAALPGCFGSSTGSSGASTDVSWYAPSAECSGDSGCIAGYACIDAQCVEATCPDQLSCASPSVCVDGRCVEKRPEGSSCQHNVDCAAGLVCNWGKGYVCALPSLPGEPCKDPTDRLAGYTCPDTLGATCDCAMDCPEGTSCGLDGCVAPHLVPLGEPCAYNVNCAEGLICAWDEAPWVCTAPRQVGEACGHDTDCEQGQCDAATGTCDHPCSTSEDCPSGLVCHRLLFAFNGHTTYCAPPVAAGMMCHGPESCEAGLVCDHTSHCASPVALGDACQTGADCAIGATCVNAQCALPGGAGDPCAVELWNLSHPSCGDGLACLPLWVGDYCNATLSCQPPRAEGELCECDAGPSAIIAADRAGLLCVEGTTCRASEGADEASRCLP